MTIFGILVALALLYWLGSLGHEYCANPIERARLNKQPGQMLFALLAAALLVMFIVGICIPPFGNLAISVGDQQFRVWAIGLVGCLVLTVVSFMTGRM